MNADLSGKSLCSSLRVLSALRGETTVQRMARTPAIRCGAAVGDSLWRATGHDAAERLKLRSSDVWRWLKQRRSSGTLTIGVIRYLGLKPRLSTSAALLLIAIKTS